MLKQLIFFIGIGTTLGEQNATCNTQDKYYEDFIVKKNVKKSLFTG